jgi:peptidoglycan/LPS O-acetylase OafA/YrhL
MNFRNDINSLRAVAVLAVVLFHFQIPGFSGGFVGVDVFFVISGFLMTAIIFGKTRTGQFSLLKFYLDRARRIIPALACVCLSVLFVTAFFLLPSEYKILGQHVATSISFLSNFAYWHESGYFDTASRGKWLLHTWSLSIEWQLYIVYPIAIIFFNKVASDRVTRLAMIGICILCFLLSGIVSSRSQVTAFYLLPTRAWEMLAGGLVFLYPFDFSSTIRRVIQATGLAIIAFSIFFFTSSNVWPGWLAAVPVMGTAMVTAANRKELVLLKSPSVQFLGKISYSVYLWHWPIVVFLAYFDKDHKPAFIVAGLICSVLLGFASFSFVEVRFKNWTIRAFYESRLRGCFAFASIIAVIGSLGTGAFLLNGLPSRVPVAVRVADYESQDRNPLARRCFIRSGIRSPGCVMGGNGKDVRVIVIGDSHSQAIVSAVVSAIPRGQAGGVKFLGYQGCVTIPGANILKYPDCAKYTTRLFATLEQEYSNIPIIVINRTSNYVLGKNENDDDRGIPVYVSNVAAPHTAAYFHDFESRYVTAMCDLAVRHPVYITKPTPEMDVNVPATLGKYLIRTGHAPDISISMDEYLKRHAFALSIMDEAKRKCGVHLLDPTQYLCHDGRCMGSLNGRPLYFDAAHMSEYGNQLLEPMFVKVFG